MLADIQSPAPPEPTDTDIHGFDQRAGHGQQLPSDFTHGIRHLTRSVTVLTSSDEHGERYGATTTGVCALSTEPPTLVVCLRRRSRLGSQLPRTRNFCVNVLSAGQRTVAEAFAGRRGVDVDRFNHGEWKTADNGSPMLANALASFECEVDLIYGYPNHLIVIANVGHVGQIAEHSDPLVYASGQLSSLVPSEVAVAS